jgi:hypothetical protein
MLFIKICQENSGLVQIRQEYLVLFTKPKYGYVVDSDIAQQYKRELNCLFSIATLLIFVSHFPAKVIQNGSTDMCIKESKDANWQQCYILCTFSILFPLLYSILRKRC